MNLNTGTLSCIQWKLKEAIFVAIVCAALFNSFLAEAWAKPKIGMVLFTQDPHHITSLAAVQDKLKKAGFGEDGAEYVVKNAEGNKAKAAALAKEFAAAKLDLIIVFGTSAAIAVTQKIKDTPIVFCNVYDPVESRIVKSLKNTGNNVTGVSNKVSAHQIITILKELATVKKLGALYQPNEKNSVSHLKALEKEQSNAHVKVVPVPITAKEELALLLPYVMQSVDAIYICGSSIVGDMIFTVTDMAIKSKMITVTHLAERVEKGVLLGISSNSYALGLLAGEMAVRVLQGTKPSAIPVEQGEKVDIILNMKTAKAGQYQIPSAFMEKVTKIVE